MWKEIRDRIEALREAYQDGRSRQFVDFGERQKFIQTAAELSGLNIQLRKLVRGQLDEKEAPQLTQTLWKYLPPGITHIDLLPNMSFDRPGLTPEEIAAVQPWSMGNIDAYFRGIIENKRYFVSWVRHILPDEAPR